MSLSIGGHVGQFRKAQDALNAKHYSEAATLLAPLVNDGNAKAAWKLGKLYMNVPTEAAVANTDVKVNDRKASTNDLNIKALTHPILQVAPHEPRVQKALEDQAFRKMINLKIPEGSRRQWGDAFEHAEEDAASKLRSRLQGLSEAQVVSVLGGPAFRAGSPLCFEKNPGEDNWLYFFGGTPELLRINFRNGKCDYTSALNYDEDSLYNDWRARELGQFAIGKALSRITAYAGQPISHTSKNEIQERAEMYQDQNIPERIWRSADAVLQYQFGHPGVHGGKVSGENLFIKDGRCTHAGPGGGYISVMAGVKYQPSTPLGATGIFRMPQ